MKKQRRIQRNVENRVAKAFEAQRLAKQSQEMAVQPQPSEPRIPERIIVKTNLGDIDLGMDTDRELLDKEVADQVSRKVLKGGTAADELAKASLAKTNFDLVGIVANIMATAGIDKERIDVFTDYAFIASVRKTTTSTQMAMINSFFHHELANYGLRGYYPRSVLIQQADLKLWVRSFVDIVIPFIRDYKLPVLEGQVLDLESAHEMEKRNMEMIQRGLQFASEQEQADTLASEMVPEEVPIGVDGTEKTPVVDESSFEAPELINERPLSESDKPLDTPVGLDVQKV